jgi:hypothetical protein
MFGTKKCKHDVTTRKNIVMIHGMTRGWLRYEGFCIHCQACVRIEEEYTSYPLLEYIKKIEDENFNLKIKLEDLQEKRKK